MQIYLMILGSVLGFFFLAHYVFMIKVVVFMKNKLDYSQGRFNLLVGEYVTFSNCVKAYNRATTDEERQKILDIMNINASTSILREGEF